MRQRFQRMCQAQMDAFKLKPNFNAYCGKNRRHNLHVLFRVPTRS
jgi:hypothetical protein